MSKDLIEFANKLASTLDAYAESAPARLSTGVAPFHVSMMKMAESLKHRHSMQKRAFGLGTLGMLAPGLLAGAGGMAAMKRLRPMMQGSALKSFKPQELFEHGMTGMAQSGGVDDILAALQRSPVGREAAEQIGRVHSQRSVQPMQMGLAGLGGLAAGQFLNRDKGQSGPPMIIA